MSNEANANDTNGAHRTGAPVGASDDLARAADQLASSIVDEARVSLGMAFRYLDAALWRMPTASRRLAAPLATDGARLYVDAVRVIARFRTNPDEVARDVLHAVLHCMLRHPFAPQRAQAYVWACACDIAVESMALDLCAGRFACAADDTLAPLIEACDRDLGVLTPAKLYRAGVRLFSENGSDAERPVWAQLFAGALAPSAARARSARGDQPGSLREGVAGTASASLRLRLAHPGVDAGAAVDAASASRGGRGGAAGLTSQSRAEAGDALGMCVRDSHELWRTPRPAAGSRAGRDAGASASAALSASDGAEKAIQRPQSHAASASKSARKSQPAGDYDAARETGRAHDGEAGRHVGRQASPRAFDQASSNQEGRRKPPDARSTQARACEDDSTAARGKPSARRAAGERSLAHAGDSGASSSAGAARKSAPHADAAAERAGSSAASDGLQPADARHVPAPPTSSASADAAGAPTAGDARPAPAPSARSLSAVDPAALERSWEQVARTVSAGRAAAVRGRGNGAGAFEQNLELACRTRTDYADFLRRFATVAEDQRLSPDEFDYVYYAYGLRQYGNLPLIEPLEYQERRRVREFVIAIDTSGSTRGDLVRAFVTRTYEILQAHEQFGDNVNIHLVQADARIQSDTVVRSIGELDRFARTMTVRGGGGTDFRPVFAYVERLRAHGAFRNLQGLVYFTDGWGTFPDRPPTYDVAFVFVEEDGAARWVPPWAMRVVMDKDQVRDLGRESAARAGGKSGRADMRADRTRADARADCMWADARQAAAGDAGADMLGARARGGAAQNGTGLKSSKRGA